MLVLVCSCTKLLLDRYDLNNNKLGVTLGYVLHRHRNRGVGGGGGGGGIIVATLCGCTSMHNDTYI